MVDLDVFINYRPNGMNFLPIIFCYVKTICISLSDPAFFCEFVIGKEIYLNHDIDKKLNFNPTMRRMFYKYFKYVLFITKVIFKSSNFLLIIWT